MFASPKNQTHQINFTNIEKDDESRENKSYDIRKHL